MGYKRNEAAAKQYAEFLRDTIRDCQFTEYEIATALFWLPNQLGGILLGKHRAIAGECAKIFTVLAEYDRREYLAIAGDIHAAMYRTMYGGEGVRKPPRRRDSFDLIQIFPFHRAPSDMTDHRRVISDCLEGAIDELPKVVTREEINQALDWKQGVCKKILQGNRRIDGVELSEIAALLCGYDFDRYDELIAKIYSAIWDRYLTGWLTLPPDILRESKVFPVGRLRRLRGIVGEPGRLPSGVRRRSSPTFPPSPHPTWPCS